MERGTATFDQGSKAAFKELLRGNISLSFSSMIGAKSVGGFVERMIGNSRGKASLESCNRQFHIIGANLPGQIGAAYEDRPQDWRAQVKENEETWELARLLPAHLRGREGYSLLTLEQSREELRRIVHLRNTREDHQLEGFARIAEWWDGERWRAQAEWDGRPGCKARSRLETPAERAARLVREAGGTWRAVGAELLAAFYAHTQRVVRVAADGLVRLQVDGREYEFASGGAPLAGGRRCLAYFQPEDPRWLYLTDAEGRVLGVWQRRERVKPGDEAGLEESIRYSAGALRAARECAERLGAPERERVAAVRAENEALFRSAGILPAEVPALKRALAAVESPVAAGLAAVPRAESKVAAASVDADADAKRWERM
jgi:hypothetical protein